MNISKRGPRSKIIPIRATPTKKSVLETAARAQGYPTLSDFTRAAWLLMLKESDQDSLLESTDA